MWEKNDTVHVCISSVARRFAFTFVVVRTPCRQYFLGEKQNHSSRKLNPLKFQLIKICHVTLALRWWSPGDCSHVTPRGSLQLEPHLTTPERRGVSCHLKLRSGQSAVSCFPHSIHLMYLHSGVASDPTSCSQCIRPYRSPPPLLQLTGFSVLHTHTHTRVLHHTHWEWLSTKVKNRKLDDIVQCADVSSER